MTADRVLPKFKNCPVMKLYLYTCDHSRYGQEETSERPQHTGTYVRTASEFLTNPNLGEAWVYLRQMKKLVFSTYLVSILIFFGFTYAASCSDHNTPAEIQEAYKTGLKGFKFYEEGKYKQAAPLLKKATDLGCSQFASYYADICRRNLDEGCHFKAEAAQYYLEASKNDSDGDVRSYLEILVPGIFEISPAAEQSLEIVKAWTFEDTCHTLPSIKPSVLNQFLLRKLNHHLDKTTSQKLLYFFDKLLHAIFYGQGPSHSFLEEESSSSSDEDQKIQEDQGAQTSCAVSYLQSSDRSFIQMNVSCFVYGPVYFNYFKQLTDQITITQDKINVHYFYQKILGILSQHTKNKTATELAKETHRDYPWILAGIAYWKRHPENNNKEFRIQGYTEKTLIKKLENMRDPFSETEMDEILQKIEPEKIWANDHQDKICKKYRVDLLRYFKTPLSTENKLIYAMKQDFFKSLEDLHLTLDCTKKSDLQCLRTPLLMFSCQELTLINLKSNSPCSKALQAGVPYCLYLEKCNVFKASSFSSKTQSATTINEILNRLISVGVKVKYLKGTGSL